MFFLMVCFLLSEPQPSYRLRMKPFDFQRDEGKEFLTPNISGIQADGDFVFIGSGTYPEVYMLDRQGKLVRKIGGKGNGPSELGHHWPMAMSLKEKDLWVIDHNYIFAKHFVNGTYTSGFRLTSYMTFAHSGASNAFAFSDAGVLVPSHHLTGALAYFYGLDGTETPVGKPLQSMGETPVKVPYLNDTLWQWDGRHWYGCFIYAPMIQKFDRDFQRVDLFHLKDPALQAVFQDILEFVPSDNRSSHPSPLFTDFKIRGEFLYLMAKKQLFKVSTVTGTVHSSYAFFGEGDGFLGTPETDLVLHYFAFWDDKTLLLGHAWMPWEHDLWKVDLP